jgi:hypothetical protein
MMMVCGVFGAEKREREMSRHLFPFFFNPPSVDRTARRCVIKIQKLSGRIMMIARLLYDDGVCMCVSSFFFRQCVFSVLCVLGCCNK